MYWPHPYALRLLINVRMITSIVTVGRIMCNERLSGLQCSSFGIGQMLYHIRRILGVERIYPLSPVFSSDVILIHSVLHQDG
jgi:hypothetical protein